jgi:HSP20 family protein
LAWDDFPDWFRRRRRFPLFSGGFFDDIDQMMEEMLKEMGETIPKELIRDEKLPNGSTVKRMGPFVYGYSMTMGPDGKPVIREFGNIKPTKTSAFGMPKRGLEVKPEREPLVDTFDQNGTIKVVAEVPGVEKKDINLELTENSLIISVDTEKRKYYKEVELPTQIEPDSSKALYVNGVLEVTLTKRGKKPRGHKIDIK